MEDTKRKHYKSVGRTTQKRKKSIGLPRRGLYTIAAGYLKPSITRQKNVRMVKYGIENIKPPYVVLCNHCSNLDWIYVGMSFLPDLLNVVVTRYYYSKPMLKGILKYVGAIPKDQFSPDIGAVRSMLSVAKQGGNIMLFPEGRTSPHGMTETVERSTVKLLKHLGNNVVAMRLDGAYLTMPKWSGSKRRGRVDITIAPLFTPEQLKTLSEDELYDKMCEALKTDDYAWQKRNRVEFSGQRFAEGLENVLYHCPKCGGNMTTRTEDDRIFCTGCDFSVVLDHYYDFRPDENSRSCCPENIGEWYKQQVAYERSLIDADPSYSLTADVVFHQIVDEKRWIEPVGEGKCTIDREGFHYTGTRCGEPCELLIPISALPAIPFTPNESFEMYYNGEFHAFFPKDAQSSQRWSIIIEQMHNAVCGKK